MSNCLICFDKETENEFCEECEVNYHKQLLARLEKLQGGLEALSDIMAHDYSSTNARIKKIEDLLFNINKKESH